MSLIKLTHRIASGISATNTGVQDSAVSLRLMPLGDSVTWGYGSTDGNGYRKVLHDLLAQQGYVVDFVGTQKSGNMADAENEGFPGATIQ